MDCTCSFVVPRDQFIDVVVNQGQHKWYDFGSNLHFNCAEIQSLTHHIPDGASKLQALVDKATTRDGRQKAVEALVAICDKHEILGGVKDELNIKGGESVICTRCRS